VSELLKIIKIKIDDFNGSPFCSHNYPCPVYFNLHAVYDMNEGIFKPSWKAQNEGFRLIKADTKIKRFIIRVFFNEN